MVLGLGIEELQSKAGEMRLGSSGAQGIICLLTLHAEEGRGRRVESNALGIGNLAEERHADDVNAAIGLAAIRGKLAILSTRAATADREPSEKDQRAINHTRHEGPALSSTPLTQTIDRMRGKGQIAKKRKQFAQASATDDKKTVVVANGLANQGRADALGEARLNHGPRVLQINSANKAIQATFEQNIKFNPSVGKRDKTGS